LKHPTARTITVLLGLAAAAAVSVGVPSGTSAVARAASGDIVIAAVGDMACDTDNPGYNNGDGTATKCGERRTSDAVLGDVSVDTVLGLGDFQYDCGDPADYAASYDPTWGRLDSIMDPVAGNHEYLSGKDVYGATCPSDNTTANGYFAHFGGAAAPAANGHYSFNVGSWHFIALNGNCSKTGVGGCSATSPQTTWLKSDLASVDEASQPCVAAFWHQPLFTGTGTGKSLVYQPWWNALYAAGADVVLNGHIHNYQRFSPRDPTGAVDAVQGITEYVAGTGGEDLVGRGASATPQPDSFLETFGYLRMTLHPTGWSTEFVDSNGGTHDPSSGSCHGSTPPPPSDTVAPATTISCSGATCSTGWYTAPSVSAALSASDSGGSGVRTTSYTTDGTSPLTSATAVTYDGPFTVASTTTVKFASIDNAGNKEAVHSQRIRIDAAAPTVTITSPPAGTSVKRGTSVSVTASASDAGTGTAAASGVARVTFYLDGTKVGSDTSSPYSITLATTNRALGSHTLTAVVADVATNSATSAPITFSLVL
jgi:acid phosphatase type 7